MDSSNSKRRSRLNTKQERNRMKQERRKRKRMKIQQSAIEKVASSQTEDPIQEECSTALKTSSTVAAVNSNTSVVEDQAQVAKFKSMARYYWERWQWENHQRRDMINNASRKRIISQHALNQIDPAALTNPIRNCVPTEVFLGQGSFGIVRLQLFRGMKVAVKELFSHTFRQDCLHEASILSCLSHPYLPFLYGICTSSLPYRIVMQFHGVEDQAVTLHDVGIAQNLIPEGHSWLFFTEQLMSAMKYLHNVVGILHNDLTKSNVVITTASSSEARCNHQIVVIDFGKATKIDEGKMYTLSELEKSEYKLKYSHIAPEIIQGVSKQSRESDMYAVGDILFFIADHGCVEFLKPKLFEDFIHIARKCRSVIANDCLCATDAAELIQLIIRKV